MYIYIKFGQLLFQSHKQPSKITLNDLTEFPEKHQQWSVFFSKVTVQKFFAKYSHFITPQNTRKLKVF